MRILQVVTLLSPDGAYGGPARVALNQSAELINRGHEVTVVGASMGYRETPAELTGVPVKLFPAVTLRRANGFAGMAAPGLGKWLRRNWDDFDITHIHLGRDLVVLPVAAAARRRGIPYFLQTHGMVVPSSHPLSAPLDRMWTRKVLRDARAVFYLNPKERRQLVEVAGPGLRLRRAPTTVCRSTRRRLRRQATGSPVRSPDACEETPHGVCRDGEKAHRRRRRRFDSRWSATMRARGLLCAPRSRATRASCWEGAVSPDAIPARMAAAEVYVLPSVREPHPMSVLEAMSVGLPVVVTNDCGLATVVERRRSGIVTEPEVPALVAAVDSILGDRISARLMGERGRQAVHTHFGMKAIGDRLLETYGQVAEGLR